MATRVPTFIVASGATDSSQLDLQIVNTGQRLVGIVIPGTIISTTVTFKVSADGTTFATLRGQTGAPIDPLSVNVLSASAVAFTADMAAQLGGWRYVQAIMGSTETNGAILIPVIL
jgi:hypothetical protein